MSELRDLYQETILDHGKRPRNRGRLEDAESAVGRNPLCGDVVTVFVRTDGTTVEEVGFEGAGCAISTASASMMTEALRGKSIAESRRLFQAFHDMLTGKDQDEESSALLGKLIVFAGVREFPIRVKCATLPWHTMRAALEHEQEPVSTE